VRTGASWRDVPERDGPWRTEAHRFYRWRHAGVCHRLLDTLTPQAAAGQLDGPRHCIDRTMIRAHQPAAGAQTGARQPKRAGAVRGASAPKSTCGRQAPVNSCRGA
jgi:transposase